MLLQTNSYIVPKEHRAEHARLMRRFRQVLHGIGCDNFEIYEQVGANWANSETTGRFVQIMRFRDRKHQLAVQNAERTDPAAQQLIAEFCALINYPYQQQQGQFAVGYYSSILPVAPERVMPADTTEGGEATGITAPEPTDVKAPPVPQNIAFPDTVSEEATESPEETFDDRAIDASLAGEGNVRAMDDLPAVDEEGPPSADPLKENPAQPAFHEDSADLDVLEGDLELDDDLSRLANELAAREELDDSRHGGGNNAPRRGSTSENGAH